MSETTWGEVRKKKKERKGGWEDANDVMIEIKRIKNVKFLTFAGFLLPFAQFGSQKDIKTKWKGLSVSR